jgi:hypothetical protein
MNSQNGPKPKTHFDELHSPRPHKNLIVKALDTVVVRYPLDALICFGVRLPCTPQESAENHTASKLPTMGGVSPEVNDNRLRRIGCVHCSESGCLSVRGARG